MSEFNEFNEFNKIENTSKKAGRVRTARNHSTQKAIRIILIVVICLAALSCVAFGALNYMGWLDAGREKASRENETVIIDGKALTPATDEDGNQLTDENGNLIYLDENGNQIVIRDEIYNFLLVGQDKKAMLTDVIMLINFDAKNGKIAIMQFPRDSFIKVSSKACMSCKYVPSGAQASSKCPECSSSLTTVGTGSGQKMNSVYNTYYSALKKADSSTSEKERTLFGMAGLASEIERNLAINIDYEVHMDLQGFRDIVDAIGGVQMNVPENMYYTDPGQGLYINLKAGDQLLDGEKAEQFVRFRYGYVNGDLGRQDAQKLFMVAFFKNFKEKVSVTNVFSILSSMMEHVTHTVPSSDLDYFGRQALGMDFNNITMFTAPNTPTYIGKASYVVLHRYALLDAVNNHFNLMADKKISDYSFDPNRNFTVKNDSAINAIYETKAEFEGMKTAQDIEDNGIYIP